MNKRKKIRIIKNVLFVILFTFSIVGVILISKKYNQYLDIKTEEKLETIKGTFISKDAKLNYNGLYIVSVKDELDQFLRENNYEKITYKVDKESFYIEFTVVKGDDENYIYNIDKIVNKDLNINARLNIVGVQSIEFRSSSRIEQAVIKITTIYDQEFFAMANGAYHLLGDDIEEIGFIDEHFYHMVYNPKYISLRDVDSCSKEVKKSIKNFNGNEYYYKYGRINFLSDYYQKLSSKTYTVSNKCDELQAQLEANLSEN